MKAIDITSRLGQFAWRQLTPTTTPLPVVFRNENREEYLCVQMLNIHLLSKYSSELISYCMTECPIQYYSLTRAESKLFQSINQFHSNGSLAKHRRLDYSRKDLAFITPLISFLSFYQFIENQQQKLHRNSVEKTINTNSYCRLIKFHEKDILSYVTTSTIDSNQTILCLSINDVVSTYFPWTTQDKFIHLCRSKQILRYKPDKSTQSDLSLRLINLQQLEKFWFYFIEQLLPNDKKVKENPIRRKKSPIKTNEKIENVTVPLPEPIEQSEEKIPSVDQEQISQETKSLLDHLLTIIEEQQISSENQIQEQKTDEVIKDVLQEDERDDDDDEKTILSRIENKSLKRRRSPKSSLSLRKRRRKQSNNQIQSWIQKYSIEPISIILQRVSLPAD